MVRLRSVLRALVTEMLLSPSASSGHSVSTEEYVRSSQGIGAYQSLRCPEGGFVEGVRSSGGARARRLFSSIQLRCVARHSYVDDKLHVFFTPEGNLCPDGGA